MKINLGKNVLNVKLIMSREPNFRKLSKELSDYFSENEIEGRKIKEFEFDRDFKNTIVPTNPYIEGEFLGGNYENDLEKIGKKYGLEKLGFIYWCYGK